MKKIPAYVVGLSVLLLSSGSAWSDSGSGADAFCLRAKDEINALIRRCRPDRSGYWHQRYDDAQKKIHDAIELGADPTPMSKLLKLQGRDLQVRALIALDSLNTSREVELDQYTALVEDLGQELINDKIDTLIMPMVRRLDTEFVTFQGKPHSESLDKSYSDFLDVKRRISQFESEVPVKETYHFEPIADPNDASKPIKSTRYQFHDWVAGLNNVDALVSSLQPIQKNLDLTHFFAPKDPIPWLPIATQLSVLLVSMAGWIKSYHDDTAYWVIALLVFASMGLSFYLVFSSTETWWNILRQSLIPGFFIIYWIGKKRGWWSYWIAKWKGA